jgi:aspartate aminotransferase-like enzyme
MMGVPEYGSADVENYYVLKTGASALVPVKGKFKKRMTEFFADAPAIVNKINTEEYKKGDIEEIVREYNQFKGK